MFAAYAGDVLARAEASALAAIRAERAQYDKFMRVVETFAADNHLIVGGATATRMLLGSADEKAGADKSPDWYHVELFSAHAREHAHALASALYAADPDCLGHYAMVATKIADEELTVSVNLRELVKVRALVKHRGTHVSDVLMPAHRIGTWTDTKLLCMAPEVQLTAVYAGLCNPAHAGEWRDLLDTEKRLRAMLQAEIRKKMRAAVRGGAEEVLPKRRHALACDVLRELGQTCVLTCDSSRAVRAKQDVTRGRLYFATDAAPREAAAQLRAIAARHSLALDITDDHAMVPTHPRLRRTTASLNIGGRKDVLAYLFHVANYELVPYTLERTHIPDGLQDVHVRVGSHFVDMRFLLTEMWILQLLYNMGKLNEQVAMSLLLRRVDMYDAAAGEVDKLLSDTAGLGRAFPESYFGRLEDADLAAKRAAQSARKFHGPYYPARRAKR